MKDGQKVSTGAKKMNLRWRMQKQEKNGKIITNYCDNQRPRPTEKVILVREETFIIRGMT